MVTWVLNSPSDSQLEVLGTRKTRRGENKRVKGQAQSSHEHSRVEIICDVLAAFIR